MISILRCRNRGAFSNLENRQVSTIFLPLGVGFTNNTHSKLNRLYLVNTNYSKRDSLTLESI